jgi:hypothetical protein
MALRELPEQLRPFLKTTVNQQQLCLGTLMEG